MVVPLVEVWHDDADPLWRVRVRIGGKVAEHSHRYSAGRQGYVTKDGWLLKTSDKSGQSANYEMALWPVIDYKDRAYFQPILMSGHTESRAWVLQKLINPTKRIWTDDDNEKLSDIIHKYNLHGDVRTAGKRGRPLNCMLRADDNRPVIFDYAIY